MFGCAVLGGTTPQVVGTRGIGQSANRTGVGVVELTLDLPMAPHEYSITGGVTEYTGVDVSFVPVKKLVAGVATIEIQTLAEGVAADLDFDVLIFRYANISQ